MGKKYIPLLVLVMFFATLLFEISCKKDETTKPPGDLKVVVCDTSQTHYFGGAEVFLYKSGSDRSNDLTRKNYYRKTTGDNTDPINIGAMFYSLPSQTYYIYARRDLGGGKFFTGIADCFVPSGMTKTLVVVVQ